MVQNKYFFRNINNYFVIKEVFTENGTWVKAKLIVLNPDSENKVETKQVNQKDNLEISELLTAYDDGKCNDIAWIPISEKELAPNEKTEIDLAIDGKSCVEVFDLPGDEKLLNSK